MPRNSHGSVVEGLKALDFQPANVGSIRAGTHTSLSWRKEQHSASIAPTHQKNYHFICGEVQDFVQMEWRFD